MREENIVDRVISFGAGFDWITPVASMIGNALSDRRHYGVPVDYINHVDAAAKQMSIRLHNRSVFAGQYQFDCEPGQWHRIATLVGLEK